MIDFKNIIDNTSFKTFLPKQLTKVLSIKALHSKNYDFIFNLTKVYPNIPEIFKKFNALKHFQGISEFNNIFQQAEFLGHEKISNMLILNMFISSEVLEDEMRRHWSLATLRAMFALHLNSFRDKKNDDYIFMSALLMDIGKIFLKKFFPMEYDSIYDLRRSDFEVSKLELDVIGSSIYELSSYILYKAGFSEVIWKPILQQIHRSENQENEEYVNLSNNLKASVRLTRIFFSTDSDIIKHKDEAYKLCGIESNELNKLLIEIPDNYTSFITDSGYDLIKVNNYISILENMNRNLLKLNSSIETINHELDLERKKTKLLAEKMESLNIKLINMALKDPLTGAYNRRYLNEFLEVEIARAKRSGTTISIIATDIDHFKKINDTYGHSDGDIVLKEIVKIFKNCIRATDIVSRTGGEEFVIVCQSQIKQDGIIVAEKIRKSVKSTPLKISKGQNINVTLSFGLAFFNPEKPNSIDQLLNLADEKLYEAKNSGRDRVCY
ncbi:MAG: diguanylate cyclase [Candidatus Delongbacteria bacterium]|nr:diguanylate cyclase [Candidatus Delongbacteria bacterium]MBN2836778.1 diguanylate cyclase [Candidatus Delongbacteria bacterium]